MPKWDFPFFPTLTGAVILVMVAILFNNLMKSLLQWRKSGR
jgi:CBS-domain-containing membrane protein